MRCGERPATIRIAGVCGQTKRAAPHWPAASIYHVGLPAGRSPEANDENS
jgi:hypothetical protein